MDKPSKDIRQRIVTAFYASVTTKDLAMQTSLSERTIQKYRRNFHLHGTLYAPKAKKGRPSALTPSMEEVGENRRMQAVLLTNCIGIAQVSRGTTYSGSMGYAVLSFRRIRRQNQSVSH